ncbi:MAG: EamA family transporter [Candidatus Fermentibacteraceae bacterium]|nr:EamA family transporter [Candidatus Fermentibacteraceae bacterium]
MSRSLLFSLAATLLWGVWGITAKLAADRLGHWPSLFLYSMVSFAIIATMFLLSGSTLRHVPAGGLILAAAAGLSGALAVAAFQKALSCGPLSSSISLTALYPVIPVLYGVIILSEKITLARGAGMGLAIVAGVLLCF